MSLRGNLQSYLLNDVYDYIPEEQMDEFEEKVEKPMSRLLCQLLGHEIEDDMCMKPEHRYCIWCSERETSINSRTDAPLDGTLRSG